MQVSAWSAYGLNATARFCSKFTTIHHKCVYFVWEEELFGHRKRRLDDVAMILLKKDDDYFIRCRRYLFLDLLIFVYWWNALVYSVGVSMYIAVFVLVKGSRYLCVSFGRNVRSFAVSASIIYKGIKMAKPTRHAHLSKMPPPLPSSSISLSVHLLNALCPEQLPVRSLVCFISVFLTLRWNY